MKWDNYLSFERDLPFGQTIFIYLKKALFLVWLKLTFIVALERKYFWNVSIISPWKTSESMLPSWWLSVRAFEWYKSEKKIDNDDGHFSFKIHLILRHSPHLNEDLSSPGLWAPVLSICLPVLCKSLTPIFTFRNSHWTNFDLASLTIGSYSLSYECLRPFSKLIMTSTWSESCTSICKIHRKFLGWLRLEL